MVFILTYQIEILEAVYKLSMNEIGRDQPALFADPSISSLWGASYIVSELLST